MTRLAFIDTETTGLDNRRHEIWEVALIIRETGANPASHQEYIWQLPVDLEHADPIALNIGRFHDRRWSNLISVEGAKYDDFVSKSLDGLVIPNAENPFRFIIPEDYMSQWAGIFTNLTRDAFLIGNVISFDEERLRKLLRDWGQCPMWNYHLVDVEALAAGKLGIQPPWKGSTVSEALGVPVPEDQHSALADAQWAMQMYDRVFEIPGDW